MSVVQVFVERQSIFWSGPMRRVGDTMFPMNATERYREAEAQLWQQYGLEPTERYVELSEPALRLRVVEVGSGRPVLFIPGTGGTGPYWAPLIRELSDVRCLLLDRPGWGLSSPIDYRSGNFGSLAASTLVKLLDALQLDRVDIVGASIGGLWALHVAQRHPSRVGRVVLAGRHASLEIGVPRFIKLLSSPIGAVIVRVPMSRKMLEIAITCGRSWAQRRCRTDGGFHPLAARRSAGIRRRCATSVPWLAHFGWAWLATWVHHGGPDLAEVPQPVRMIFGSADPTGTPDSGDGSGSAAEWRAGVGPGAGHQPWWDEPTEVGAQVGSFLTR